MYVRDLEGNEYPCQATITQNYELNGNQTLSAVILPSKVNKKFMDDISEMWEIVDFDGVAHKIVYVSRKGEGLSFTVEIEAIPLFFDVMDTMRIYEEYNEHMTPNRCFYLIFRDSGFNFILNGTFEAVQWEGFGAGETRLELFKKALERYKAEFRISGKLIYLENLVGRDTQFMYRHRLNASNIEQENDATEMWTYARGYGDYDDVDEDEGGGGWENAKLKREYLSPLAEIIGRRDAPPIKDGRIKHESVMDEALKTLVDESLKISISTDLLDLREKGYELAQPELGDRVFLIDDRIGFKETVRVVDMTVKRNWRGEILSLNLTFGTPGVTKRYQSNLSTAVKDITEVMAGRKKIPFSVLDDSVLQATKLIQNANTELQFPSSGGILAVDPNNPNYLVAFTSRGIGVSSDGGATFPEAITGLGINASVITTGSMLADRIAGGILSSLNGRTTFNLNDGILEMTNTEFKLGGGADIHMLDAGNKLYFRNNDWSAGVGVGRSINNTYPFVYIGVSKSNKPTATDAADFSGFISNANDRESVDGIGNSVVGNRFHVRDNAVSFSKGFLFNVNQSTPYFSPMNTGSYSYTLGSRNNRWAEIYGTLAGTSSHNAKMNIEDVDGKQAFDYFDLMKIKSYYYKDDDYTNKYNRKVGPVIEQLDPTLENLYKANESALDINSNLFLLARAFQYFVEEVNVRLGELENGGN